LQRRRILVARGSTIEQQWSHAMLIRDRLMIKNQTLKFRSHSRKYESEALFVAEIDDLNMAVAGLQTACEQ
jgi:hypothetical protein